MVISWKMAPFSSRTTVVVCGVGRPMAIAPGKNEQERNQEPDGRREAAESVAPIPYSSRPSPFAECENPSTIGPRQKQNRAEPQRDCRKVPRPIRRVRISHRERSFHALPSADIFQACNQPRAIKPAAMIRNCKTWLTIAPARPAKSTYTSTTNADSKTQKVKMPSCGQPYHIEERHRRFAVPETPAPSGKARCPRSQVSSPKMCMHSAGGSSGRTGARGTQAPSGLPNLEVKRNHVDACKQQAPESRQAKRTTRP